MHEETYSRAGISFPLRIEPVVQRPRPTDPQERYSERVVSGRQLTDGEISDWMRKMRNTLDIIPQSHLALFVAGDSPGYVKIGPQPVSGGGAQYRFERFRSGGTSNHSHVHISYDAMEEGYNAGMTPDGGGPYMYGLLHEIGHLVDHYEAINATDGGRSAPPAAIRRLKVEDPLGCLAMLRRYHVGQTGGPGEHYADIYADYWYKEVLGCPYNLNRNETGWRCESCASWDAALVERLRRRRIGFPASDFNLITTIRFDALFRSPGFHGIARAGVHQRSTPVAAPDETTGPTGRVMPRGRTNPWAPV